MKFQTTITYYGGADVALQTEQVPASFLSDALDKARWEAMRAAPTIDNLTRINISVEVTP